MALTLDQLEAEAAKRSPDERSALIERLHELDEPADPEVQAAWDAEILRRIRQVDSGEVELLDGPTVMAELRKKYGQ